MTPGRVASFPYTVRFSDETLQAIRQNDDIRGLSVQGSQLKCSAFAYDLLLYVSSPLISLPNLMSTLQTYSHFSNHKINWSKSVALDVNLGAALTSHLKLNFFLLGLYFY